VTVKIAFIDGPATERRDGGVVGACRAFRGATTNEKARIPAECQFIEIGERWVSTEIVLA
jgi:hypothetical protein